jgi:hypothetical protein
MILTWTSRLLFGSPFQDSQSGMWIFSRKFWDSVQVTSGGMAFSQEIKMAALVGGFRCGETAIEYRSRGGEMKLNPLPDGVRNLAQLFGHRARAKKADGRVGRTRPAYLAIPAQASARERPAVRHGDNHGDNHARPVPRHPTGAPAVDQ